MRKPKPSGRTRLLGAGGAPVTDTSRLVVEKPRPTPKAARPAVPYHHGNRDWETLNRIGMARREGNDPVPSWQRTMRQGCTGCMARPGLLPPDHEKARGMMLEWGWVFSAGRWICGMCARDERNR